VEEPERTAVFFIDVNEGSGAEVIELLGLEEAPAGRGRRKGRQWDMTE
jgi:hypothetical protein